MTTEPPRCYQSAVPTGLCRSTTKIIAYCLLPFDYCLLHFAFCLLLITIAAKTDAFLPVIPVKYFL